MNFKYTDFSFLTRWVATVGSGIKKEHEQFVSTVVRAEASSYASRNLPAPEDTTLDGFLLTVRSFYNKLKKDVSMQLQGSIQRALGNMNLKTAEKSIHDKQEEIARERDRGDKLRIDRSNIHIKGDFHSYRKQWGLLLCFAVGEICWNTSAFLRLGDIFIISVVLGAAIGLAQVSAVKSAIQIIKEISDANKRKLRYQLLMIGCFMVSVCLALLRYWFIHVGTATDVPYLIMNPLTFATLNMVFIVATALIIVFNYPSKSEIADMHRVQALDKEIEKSTQQSTQLHDALDKLVKERDFLIELRGRTEHAEQTLNRQIDDYFEHAVGVFINENTVKRSDKAFPAAARGQHTPLLSEPSNTIQLLEN